MSIRSAIVALLGASLCFAVPSARALAPDPVFAQESAECAAIMLKLAEVTDEGKEKQNYMDLGGVMIQAAVHAGANKAQMMGYQQNVEDGIRSDGVNYLTKKIERCKAFVSDPESKLAHYAIGG